jgi:hypothetical protein
MEILRHWHGKIKIKISYKMVDPALNGTHVKSSQDRHVGIAAT